MLALDHIVVCGLEVEQTSEKYGRQLPIKAIKGGEHENWGTNNYLAYFSNDSYLEWLAVTDEEKAKHATNPLIKHLVHQLEQKKAGPFQFALRTTDMDQYVQHFMEEGIPFSGPFSGEREKPDGTLLKWRMLFPQYDYEQETLPFLIEWDENHKEMDMSILNPQAITSIEYNGIDIDQFSHIYQIRQRKLLKNQLSLQKTKITFHDSDEFTFKLE